MREKTNSLEWKLKFNLIRSRCGGARTVTMIGGLDRVPHKIPCESNKTKKNKQRFSAQFFDLNCWIESIIKKSICRQGRRGVFFSLLLQFFYYLSRTWRDEEKIQTNWKNQKSFVDRNRSMLIEKNVIVRINKLTIDLKSRDTRQQLAPDCSSSMKWPSLLPQNCQRLHHACTCSCEKITKIDSQ